MNQIIPFAPPCNSAPELREYQREVVERCRQQFSAGKRRICLVAPTGSGKTIIAGAIIREAEARGESILILGHRREIVTQTSAKLHDFGIGHGIIAANLTRGWYHDTQVASVQTFHARAIRTKRLELPPVDLIVIDECHHVRAPTWMEIIEAYPDVPIIGLTATPCRGDGRGLCNVFDVIVECPQIAELIKAGHLVGTRTFAPAPPDLRGVETRQGDYAVGQLGERMNTDALVGDVVTNWLRHANGLKTIAFAVSVEHSQHMAREFEIAGIRAEHLDGATPTPERDAILKRLADGTTTVVANCMVLTEGFDLPDIQCLILARPTKQIGLYRQMVGRGLRPAAGKQFLTVLDHSGAIYQHGPVEDEIEWTLATDRRAINKNHDPKLKIRDGDGVQRARILDCEQCGAKRIAGSACTACGFYPQPKPRAVVFEDGELVAYERKRRYCKVKVDAAELQLFHAELAYIQQRRGCKEKWIAHRYREKFGVWPPWEIPAPKQPRPVTAAWVRSRDIAWPNCRRRRVMGKRNDDKGRLPPFVPLLKETLDCPAWKVMSHGARSLYVAIKRRYNHTSHNNGRIYLSQRDACKETGSSFEQIVRWFRELQHYGFIVMEKPGCLGVEGKGQAPRWRLTELGYMKDPPTRDFLRWKPGGRFKNEKQKPAAENRCAPLRKAGAPPLRNSAAPNGTTAAESRCKSSQPLGGAQRAPDPEGESEGPATGEPLSLYELVRGNGRFH